MRNGSRFVSVRGRELVVTIARRGSLDMKPLSRGYERRGLKSKTAGERKVSPISPVLYPIDNYPVPFSILASVGKQILTQAR